MKNLWEEMLSREEYNKIVDVLNSELPWTFNVDALNILLNNWAKNKKWMFEKMGGKLRLFSNVKTEFTNETWEATREIYDTLSVHVSNNILSGFNIKEILANKYSIYSDVGDRIGSQKITTFLKNKGVDKEKIEKYGTELSKLQAKYRSNGIMVQSIHPLDFILASSGKSWTSCHDFGNGHFGGNLEYMSDSVTLINFIIKDESSVDEMNSKIWRAWIYFGKNNELEYNYEFFIISSHYPAFNVEADSVVAQNICKIFFKQKKIQGIYADYKVDTGYNRIAYTDTRNPRRIIYGLEDKINKEKKNYFYPCQKVTCLKCMDEIIEDMSKYGDCISCQVYGYCEICGDVIYSEGDGNITANGLVCEYCYGEDCVYCDECNIKVHKDNITYVKNEDGSLTGSCNYCNTEIVWKG